MNVLSIAIALFIVFESLNIIILYFFPGSKKGNGVGIFQAYEKSKEYPDLHALIKYLINWVAGTKLIFILLLIVILVTGAPRTKLGAVIALILSIASFYWRLYPAIKDMDSSDAVSPKGYSKMLLGMITAFLLVFIGAVIITLL